MCIRDSITPMHLINVKRLAYELPREGRENRGAQSDLQAQVSAFVSERLGGAAMAPAPLPTGQAGPPTGPRPLPEAVDFVSEDDVRRAMREGRMIALKPGAIVTPSARDLADGKNILIPGDAS